ncbi:cupin domain-containing protein [Cedecea neteri]|nr:cupin domain-containing protein [Cedecea neteri]WNJ77440.1 cupin domain-containing protein [Cedecea neteri]
MDIVFSEEGEQMSTGSLPTLAGTLSDIWRSRLLGQVGRANIKLIKMGGEGIPNESHAGFAELLVVIEGQMTLVVNEKTFTLDAGDYYLVPKEAVHRVLPGSHGTLLLIDEEQS